MKNYSLRIL